MGLLDGGGNCEFDGLVLPLTSAEQSWHNVLRLILYLMGLGWIFLGVAVISDVFMAGIEKITSAKRRVKNKVTGRTVTVYVWNATVANLTLMALGSSAPEILLSLIEICSANFMQGPLGAGTIVGSAAFNLLIISAVCVLAIPDCEVRYIKDLPVYVVTATSSVMAYLWLMFILMFSSKDVCEAWEAAVTLFFCPILVLAAYLADRGYFSKEPPPGTDVEMDKSITMPDDVTDEELAGIEQQIRNDHGPNLTSEQVVKIMQAQYFQKRSRAYYRHAAMEAGLYAKKVDRSSIAPPGIRVSMAVGCIDDIEVEKSARVCEIGFAVEKYCFLENCGNAKIQLIRKGPSHCRVSVNYMTKAGTAQPDTDYEHSEGTVTFEKDETEKLLLIPIKDDNAYEDDEDFFIHLSEPRVEDSSSCSARLSPLSVVTVVIIDDDNPGLLRFRTEEVEVVEDSANQTIEIIVERVNGATGTINCHYFTDASMSAVEGIDFQGAKGTLEFGHNVSTVPITITINARGRVDSASFLVCLAEPKGCQFDKTTDGGEEQCICNVTIKKNMSETRVNLFKEMKERAISANAIMGSKHWSEQFKDAIFKVGDDDDEEDEEDGTPGAPPEGPAYMDYFIHIISIPWKLLFAFVPPVDYCGGWACFCGALVMIAVVTALVSDMANLVGCCLGILPETAAITFVALGTSLPDTFASMTAAMMDPYADASIGNITGSNSINVFMGIGLAWSLAAFKWEMGERDAHWEKGFCHLAQDEKDNVMEFLNHDPKRAVFITPAGSIWFNLAVFSLNAFFAIHHLNGRRLRFGGELGGPKKGFMGQYFSAGFLVLQWFIYIITSIIFARAFADPLTYGQMAAMDSGASVSGCNITHV